MKSHIPNIVESVFLLADCHCLALPVGQGCSVLKNPNIFEDIINIHAVVEEFLTPIVYCVFAEDIERKTSQFSHRMRVGANT